MFGSDVKPASGKLDRNFFVVYTDDEKIYCRKEKPMTAFMRVRAETQPYFTGVGETPPFYKGVVETPPDCSIIAGTPPFVQ